MKKLTTRYLPFFYSLVVTGCMTNPATGTRKIFGFIPAGTADVSEPSVKAMAFAQLAPLVWASIPLIICGIFWWKLTGGSTGLGKMSVATGFLFITIAVVFPAMVGYVGAIAILALLGAIGYAVYYHFKKSKRATLKS